MMASAAPARFTFDLDLGHRNERQRMISERALDDLLSKARLDGYADGFAEGERGVASTTAQLVAAAAESFADRAAAMTTAVEDARRTALAEASHLAMTVGSKLAHQLIAREPAAELKGLIEDCLASLQGVPHLVIRCHPDLAESVRIAAEARTQVSGFTGRLVIIADPEEAISDGRIEWADGGIVRNVAAISEQIDKAIAAYLAARGVSSTEEIPL